MFWRSNYPRGETEGAGGYSGSWVAVEVSVNELGSLRVSTGVPPDMILAETLLRWRPCAFIQGDARHETPMTDFFISYTNADRFWAEWIAFTLEEAVRVEEFDADHRYLGHGLPPRGIRGPARKAVLFG